jgi:hypothetical protein
MLAGLGWRVLAAPLPAYRIGDVAEAEVTTPVALEVVDPAATVALRAAKAKEVPVVFRSFPVTTNGLTVEFLNVFARAQANFLAALTAGFQTQRVSPEVLASPEFARCFTTFNEHSRFPITTELAAEWAQGGDGAGARDALLGRLLVAARRPVRPDDLPTGFVPGQTVRLVTVTVANQELSPEEVQRGRLVPGAELITVGQAQQLFCDGFSATEQHCARAVAALLKPNCFPDAALTELVSGIAVCQLVATEHLAAGSTILHRGDRVDARAKAALDALAPVLAQAAVKTEPPVSVVLKAAPIPVKTAEKTVVNPPPTASAWRPGAWLILVLSGISVGALLLAGWQMVVVRRRNVPAPSMALSTLIHSGEPVANLTQVLRDAVVQEMAWQRRELLVAQQTAADEMAVLIRRLDELQLPIQERERTYEARIRALEAELAQRTKENQELLQLKLEIVRRQLETERSSRTASEAGRAMLGDN